MSPSPSGSSTAAARWRWPRCAPSTGPPPSGSALPSP
ncbi:hypothetical protein STAFG_6044 [Streptomyces afghaniensis 772]|uniref:Uncharacterized protein n=1 Tax=Streptomyces afghaniensis 772 TaxID=1283301 RepID=S4MJZ0_9ACTN|nr:hypothetical protein STAFG_6044 [Streptomyces afghaniensis 772]